MKKSLSLFILFIFLFSGFASAEYYKYTDKDGNVRFTDDLSKIPESQRIDVTTYEDSQSKREPTNKPTPEPKKSNHPLVENPKKDINIETQGKQIKQRQDVLNKEFQSLQKEKAKLQKARNKKRTVNETKAFNRKVTELNEKIYQWDQKRKAVNAELEAYNAKLAEQLKKDK